MSAAKELILIIDDDEGDFQLLSRHLKKIPEWDFDFLHASDAEEGRRLLATENVWMTFLDYHLGTIDGLEVLKAIRDDGDLRPVIIATGRGDEYAAAHLTRAGADDYIVKGDLDADVLRRSIGYAYAKYRGREAEARFSEKAAELELAHGRLAVAHQTLERRADELEIANDRLHAVDELKTKFLSEVSHELRTPMASIVSAAKIMRKHHAARPEVVERFSKIILSEGDRLTRLINEFLDLTKIESGCMQWDDAFVEPESLANDAVNGMIALAQEHEVKLDSNADADLPQLMVDYDRIIQVLTNLFSNAIKFTPAEGSVTLHVRSEGDSVFFSVVDTGPGIPADQLHAVFDRFAQVTDEDGTRRKAGTGIGLAICREVVEHYSGRIWVESEEGEGSRFNFILPTPGALIDAVSNVSDTVDRVTGAEGETETETPSTTAARVLVIAENCADVEAILAQRADVRIEPRVCATLDQAYARLTTWRADVVIVTEAVAGDSGDDAVEELLARGAGEVLFYSNGKGFVHPVPTNGLEVVVRSLACSIKPGASVLVVEDDAEYRRLLVDELSNAGYEVASVANGRDGLAELAANPPDALVLDVVIPYVDGLSVLEQLTKQGARLPVLVLTAMDDPHVAHTARELGALGMFSKEPSKHRSVRPLLVRIQQMLGPVLAEAAGEAVKPGQR